MSTPTTPIIAESSVQADIEQRQQDVKDILEWVNLAPTPEQEQQLPRLRDLLLARHPQLQFADLKITIKGHPHNPNDQTAVDVRWSECEQIWSGNLQLSKGDIQKSLDYAEEQLAQDLGLHGIARGWRTGVTRSKAGTIPNSNSLSIEDSKIAIKKIETRVRDPKPPEMRLTLDPEDTSADSPYMHVERFKEKLIARYPGLKKPDIMIELIATFPNAEPELIGLNMVVLALGSQKECAFRYDNSSISGVLSQAEQAAEQAVEQAVEQSMRMDKIIRESEALAALYQREEVMGVYAARKLAEWRFEEMKAKLVGEGRISEV